MKFTNEQAVEALRAELTNKGRKALAMSERTLAKQTEILVKNFANDETGLPEFVSDVIEILSTMEGNIRKTNSDFVNKWKDEHSDSNSDSDPESKKPTADPALKAYEERIAALEKRLQESDRQSVLMQKRRDITAKLKEKGVKDDEWLNDFLSEVNITEDLDVDAKSDSWVRLYNKSKANGGSSVPPANPSGAAANSTWAQKIKAAAELGKRKQGIIETNKE